MMDRVKSLSDCFLSPFTVVEWYSEFVSGKKYGKIIDEFFIQRTDQ